MKWISTTTRWPFSARAWTFGPPSICTSCPIRSAIVEWYRGTGLRPFLELLETGADRQRFAGDYLASLRPHFPPRPAGGVLFPFRRIFLIAYR